MNCRICLKKIKNELKSKYTHYHNRCVVEFFGSLKVSPALDFTRKDFIQEKAHNRSKGMSISGVQPKLSLTIEENKMSVTVQGGEYIIKPGPEDYDELPINEFVSMALARRVGIESPLFALIEFSDGELVYIIKRFDRVQGKKLQQEDMAQAMNIEKDDESRYKYESESYESVGKFLTEHVNLIVTSNFFERVFFNFMIGNDDFHLKNISIIETSSGSGNYKLAPNYDCVNAVLYADGMVIGEVALDLFSDDFSTEKFKEFGCITQDSFDVLGEKLGINVSVRKRIYNKYFAAYDDLVELVGMSELRADLKEKYLDVMCERKKKFQLPSNN